MSIDISGIISITVDFEHRKIIIRKSDDTETEINMREAIKTYREKHESLIDISQKDIGEEVKRLEKIIDRDESIDDEKKKEIKDKIDHVKIADYLKNEKLAIVSESRADDFINTLQNNTLVFIQKELDRYGN